MKAWQRATSAAAIAAALLAVPTTVSASVGLVSAHVTPVAPQTAPERYEALGELFDLPSHVEVDTRTHYGSGVVVGHTADGGAIVATARHVFGDNVGEVSSASAWISLGDRWAWIVDRECSEASMDVCLVRTSPWPSTSVPDLGIATYTMTTHGWGATTGEMTCGVGTLGLTVTVSDASSGSDQHEWTHAARLSACGDAGDSGAGLIDTAGQLVGMYVGGNDYAGYAVTGEEFVAEMQQLRAEIERRAVVAAVVARLWG